MAKFSDNLRFFRTDRGLTQQQLADKLSISKSTISMYEQGNREPSFEVLEAIADTLNVNMAHLLGDDKHLDTVGFTKPEQAVQDPDIFAHPDILPIKTKKIPLIGEIACGEPIYANQDYESYVEVGTDVKADFAVRASGDSMLPKIQEGDIVFVTEQPIVEENEVAVVIIEDEVTLKRYRRIKEDMIMLLPDNPEHNAIFVDLKENSNVRILGKAIALQRDIK